MNARQKLHQLRLNEWTARFADQKASGLKVKDWCEQNSISHDAYYYWKRRLKDQLMDQMLPEIVPISMADPTATVPTVVPAPNPNRAAGTSCTTVATLTANGISVELTSAVTDDFLCMLIKAVCHA